MCFVFEESQYVPYSHQHVLWDNLELGPEGQIPKMARIFSRILEFDPK